MLSIVVIGKNESENLPLVISSLSELRQRAKYRIQMIYVDSDSSDLSVEIAKSFFDEIYVLSPSDHLCASAGRHIGTLKAIYEWILYLDGDMEICSEFIDFLCSTLEQLNTKFGYIGRYVYYYGDGDVKDNALNYKTNGQIVTYHGGAVLLRKCSVIDAGNWNPCIFSNEEIELYTRLRSNKYNVIFVDKPMIKHYTERYTSMKKLIMNFAPSAGLGKKFYGFGQILRARYQQKDFYSLLRYFPYPFVYWICLFITIIFICIGFKKLALIPLLSGATYIFIFKGYQYIALYVAFIIQAIVGFGKYDGSYVPHVKIEYIKNEI